MELTQHNRPLVGAVHFAPAVHPLPVSGSLTREDMTFDPAPGDVVWRYAATDDAIGHQFGLVVARWHGVPHAPGMGWLTSTLIEVLWSPPG